MKTSKLLSSILFSLCAAFTGVVVAQEGQKSTMPVIQPAAASTVASATTQGKTVMVLVDLTGSFVDHLLTGDVMDRSIKRAMREIQANVGNKSLVRVAVIGQSHRDVTDSDEHLLAKEWVVGGRHTKERVASLVRNWLEDIASDLRIGKIKKQGNSAVVMAFDRTSELVRKAGQPCTIIAISDLDETEVGYPLPAPYRGGMLTGCSVYGIGAAVTLRGGTKAERDLRRAWEQHLTAAGVNISSDFYWIPNP